MALALKVSRIGNSRGIRLPARILKRYQITDVVYLEEGVDSLLLRPKKSGKTSWETTARQMALAAQKESWSDFEETVGDGLRDL